MVSRRFLSKRDVRNLEADFYSAVKLRLSDLVGKAPRVELVKTERVELFLVNDRPLLLSVRGQIVPSLRFDEAINLLPSVVVDAGAIPHICNGADVMAPGIREVKGQFREGDLVAISEERYGKIIAIGRALVNSEVLRTLKRGRVVENLHYVGDRAWKLARAIA